MGSDLFRKYVISSIIVCYRSVVRHPVLVGMIVFMFSMYRLFPVLFSVLLSASPVIVSTAVLLGTLLSFGQPNIPGIEKEPESENKVVGHTEIVGRDGSFVSEEINGSRVNDDNMDDDGLLELGEVKSEGDEEKVVLGSRYTPLQQSEDEHIVLESDKLWEGSADPLNSNSGLMWKGVERSGDDDEDDDDDDDDEEEEEEEEEEDGSDSGDSGSDLAESSSPDASMADIIPMLDELHPLLSEEQEIRQPSHMSRDGTDAGSGHSAELSDTSSESNDDIGIEIHENLKIGDDEDKESGHVDKEDDTRSAITWTEDDQKNLMDLGTSELERNRHLENLIARRRARDDTGIENHENIKIEDEEDDDKESEHIDKEDDATSAITWTEDDQKNLMNLGTSELERNRHLENLIARRRARDDIGIENHENIKIEDEEDDDKESEHIDKEDDATSAITWTEDDQKNLMDLGTSELERNRHLENLIAKRRARDDTGVEDHENLKSGDDEDDDKESEHVDKENDTSSAITWTEDDQKNLMNLGTSEMERNRRLENLIARRRARKTMRMQDLGSADLPWNIPPISTLRTNPFDYDANDNIPGSAPSVMLQRRNPFDLPYDSSEEKPDLVGDTFQQEFADLQPKEPFFRRYESFNVGPSVFGASRSERQESKLKPYFVPERSFATFQRQFSGLSESKTSSVPDTESVSSDHENKDHSEEDERSLEAEHASEIDEHASDHVIHRRPYFVPEHVASDEAGFSSFQRQLSEVSESKESVSSDLENKDDDEEGQHLLEAEHASEIDKHVSDHVSHGRPYFVPEHVATDETSFGSFQRQLSEVSDSKVSSESDSESVSSAGDLENRDHIDLSLEPDLISLEDHEHVSGIIEHVSEHVSLISESFEEGGGVEPSEPDEAEISVESVTNQQELHSSGSSLSSSDEASEQIYNEKEGDEVAGSVSETDYFLDRGNSIERSEIDVTSLVVEESQPNEPVYDLSPQSSSITIDLHKDDSFQHIDDRDQSSSSASDVKWNSTESSSETRDAQIQVPAVPDNEEHVLPDNISTSLQDKPVLEADNVVLDLGASRDLEELQVSSSDSHARSHESFHQEDVVAQPDEESLLGRSHDKPLTEDPEQLQVQARDLEHSELALPSIEAQFTEVVHGETYENHSPTLGEDISEQQKELPLLDTSVSEPSEDNPEVLPVQITSNNSDNLQIRERDLVEVADIETIEQEIPAYASDTHSIESNVDDVDDIKEFDEDLLVELDAVGDFSVNDFGSTLNERRNEPHTSEHDLESNLHDSLVSDIDLESNLPDSLVSEHDLESNLHDSLVSEHDLQTGRSVDEVSYSRDLGPTFDEMKQEYDIETKSSGDEDSDSKDLGTALDERKQDSHVSDHDLETKQSEEMEHDPHADHDLETKNSEEMEHDPHALDRDLEAKQSEEMKQDQHASDHDLETKHSEEIKQDPSVLNHDLGTKHSEDEDFYSKDATLDEMKVNPHDSSRDLETKHSGDEDSYPKDATLEEIKEDPHALDHDNETKHSEDADSYSKDLGSTLDEMKQDQHEANQLLDQGSYSKDLDTTFNELKEGTHSLEQRLETFYSVDENFYSKHVESAFNEMKQGLHAPYQDSKTNRSGDTKITMDAEVVKSPNENDISNTKVEGTSQAEASGLNLDSDANEAVLPQETEATTSFANPTIATTANHGTENASTTSNTDKE